MVRQAGVLEALRMRSCSSMLTTHDLTCVAVLSPEAFLVEILGMYERELVAKSLMSADVFECRQHDTMTVYIAAWQMQPHLDKERVEEITKLVINDAHYQV